MRIASLCVLVLFLSSLTLAQSEKLPDILKPDAESEAEAQGIGANVFKLVPRGMFPDPSMNAYKDEDNPIGIRGGGYYYSFATGLHSYNRTPEIALERGNLSSGFYGSNFGFMADVGPCDLQDIENSPEAKFFVSYELPLYERDLKIGSFHGRRVDELAMTLQGYLPAKIDHTYLLRAINWDQADTVVAFKVSKIDKNGSLTVVWKKIADLPKPHFLYMPDEELRQKVEAVIAEEKLVEIEFIVKDNWVIYIKGSNTNLNLLSKALRSRGIRFRGENWAVGLTPKP